MSIAPLPCLPEHLISIASQFYSQGPFDQIVPLGSGNINDTYLVKVKYPPDLKFVLQRINPHVFHEPLDVMDNICYVEEHIQRQVAQLQVATARRWEIPQVLRTTEGHHHVRDETGAVWRAIAYIESAQTFDIIDSPQLAREVGVGLGLFHALIHDLPLEAMVDTLEGFHITPLYLNQYDVVCAQKSFPQNSLADYCAAFIGERRDWAAVLEIAKTEGKLKLQPIHGDPKVNNVMIDVQTGQAITLIDLDTVKPGLIHYDIGDCLRSGCNPLGEETESFDQVIFDLSLCQAILEGYSSVARPFLSSYDYDYFYDSIRLLAFELGLRFFSDYVAGNRYFKANHAEHNLNRAVVQFKLVESIEAQASAIQSLVAKLQ